MGKRLTQDLHAHGDDGTTGLGDGGRRYFNRLSADDDGWIETVPRKEYRPSWAQA